MPRWTCLSQVVLLLAATVCKASPPDEQPPQEQWPHGSWQTLMQGLRDAEMSKRAPSDLSFFGMRGKKAPRNLNFMGMRGKKDDYEMSADDWYDSWDALPDKRAPSAGFFGMRGKKRPAGFFGMRGKKGPTASNFFGVRGKKSDPSDLDALLRGLLNKENPNPWYDGVETFDGGQMQKKAPSGFMGMRGKKDQGWADVITGSPAREDVLQKGEALVRTSD